MRGAIECCSAHAVAGWEVYVADGTFVTVFCPVKSYGAIATRSSIPVITARAGTASVVVARYSANNRVVVAVSRARASTVAGGIDSLKPRRALSTVLRRVIRGGAFAAIRAIPRGGGVARTFTVGEHTRNGRRVSTAIFGVSANTGAVGVVASVTNGALTAICVAIILDLASLAPGARPRVTAGTLASSVRVTGDVDGVACAVSGGGARKIAGGIGVVCVEALTAIGGCIVRKRANATH